MNKKQFKEIEKYMSKIIWYATYVDCFNRILYEFILNGEGNCLPCDIPNLIELSAKYSRRLYIFSTKISAKLEFHKE